MKLQRSTVALVGVALLLGAGVLFSEARRSPSSPEAEQAQPAEAPIFEFAESEVAGLTVERDGETLRFERNGQNIWQMVAPRQAPAEEGAIAFLLSRLITDAPVRRLTLTPEQQAEFGFDEPAGTVTLVLEDGTTHTVVLGARDFSGEALYALVDPPQVPLPQTAGEVPLYLVSVNVANGVERPLAEWLAPTDASAPTSSEGAASTPTAGSGSEPAAPDAAPVPNSETEPGAESGSETETQDETETQETNPAQGQ